MKRLGRDAAELTALADHLTAHSLVLEMLTGPLPGIYDPTGPGRMLFGFFAAMAETERENIREATLEGLDAAARKGNHGGRPAVITDDMLHTVLRRKAAGESVEAIREDLIIPTGNARPATPASPASTGPWPNTTKPRSTPKPSNRPTPTSLPCTQPDDTRHAGTNQAEHSGSDLPPDAGKPQARGISVGSFVRTTGTPTRPAARANSALPPGARTR